MQSRFSLGFKAAAILVSVLLLAVIAVTATVCCVPDAAVYADGFSVNGKAAYLVDSSTGTVMYAKNENERLPIASMVKIMTALLVFEAVDRGELSLDEDVTVSENAASMGGSQIFLDANTSHKAGDLLKSVVVASANDSCVALAERVSGSVEGFVRTMNERAAELGMKDTNFVNCTGLPAAEGFSTAKDVSVMFRKLIEHPAYFDYSTVWLEDYIHPDGRKTSMTNTNKLVRFYNGCDGGKTGFTSEAKFCLAATAERDGMRPVAVVIGGDSSKERFAAVSNMFNHAFGNYASEKLISKGELLEEKVKVSVGKKKELSLTVSEDVAVFGRRGDKSQTELRFELPEKVKAPVEAGDVVGKGYAVRNGEVVQTFDIVAAESVKRANLFDIFKRFGNKW